MSQISYVQEGDAVTEVPTPPEVLAAQKAYAESQSATIKARLSAQVDARAEALRLSLITPGSGQAMEYQAAQSEAERALAALAADTKVTLDPADYPMLAASIGYDLDPSTGKPTKDIAGEARAIEAARQAWLAAGSAIRKARLDGKSAIDDAKTPAAAQAAFDAIAWPTFG